MRFKRVSLLFHIRLSSPALLTTTALLHLHLHLRLRLRLSLYVYTGTTMTSYSYYNFNFNLQLSVSCARFGRQLSHLSALPIYYSTSTHCSIVSYEIVFNSATLLIVNITCAHSTFFHAHVAWVTGFSELPVISRSSSTFTFCFLLLSFVRSAEEDNLATLALHGGVKWCNNGTQMLLQVRWCV